MENKPIPHLKFYRDIVVMSGGPAVVYDEATLYPVAHREKGYSYLGNEDLAFLSEYGEREFLRQCNSESFLDVVTKLEEYAKRTSPTDNTDQESSMARSLAVLQALKDDITNWFLSLGFQPPGFEEAPYEKALNLDPEPSTPISFIPSDDYAMVLKGKKEYNLTGIQAAAIKLLHEAYKNGTPELRGDTIIEGIDSLSKRLRDVFKSRPDAWNALIKPGKSKGTYRLNI